MRAKTKRWWAGLLGGFVGGAAGALDSALALMILVPTQFNLGPELGRTIKTATVLGMLTGLKCAFAYLKQAPTPPLEDTEFITKSEVKDSYDPNKPSPDEPKAP